MQRQILRKTQKDRRERWTVPRRKRTPGRQCNVMETDKRTPGRDDKRKKITKNIYIQERTTLTTGVRDQKSESACLPIRKKSEGERQREETDGESERQRSQRKKTGEGKKIGDRERETEEEQIQRVREGKDKD